MTINRATRSLAALAMTAGLAVTGAVLTAEPSQAAAPCTSYQYGRGGSGDCVKAIQTIVNWQLSGINRNVLVEDGQYGPNTEAAVRRLQSSRNLRYVDGVVGPETWSKAICYNAMGPVPDWAVAAFHFAGCSGF